VEQLLEFISNNFILAGIWMALFVMLVYSYVVSAVSPVKAVNTHEATLLINKEDAIVLDIRNEKAFKSGHILGARQLKPEALRNKQFTPLEKSKDKPIIVVCDMGNSARSIAMDLYKAGFTQTKILSGGMNAWQSASLPVTK
jgi:rhodanese-related sulfurtransferase